MPARVFRVLLCLCLPLSGCAGPGRAPWANVAPATNPLYVAASNEEVLWERTVDVLHDFHFELARENRLARVIETDWRVGSGLLEPWHHDSVGFTNRLESTLQSVRRRVQITIIPDDRGAGYLVNVAAFKEFEDLPGVAANSPGGATFSESTPLERDLNPVVGQSSPSTWIPAGRDLALEQAILTNLQAAYSG
ncbi:MAG: hypothetical protein ACF8PG_14895 [Maioricimonas sp. JB045]|uniref:hypothetical protein n=1 Tax=Maioricimonas sp. JC845 TaxID=3232138 RepID=UPI00345856CE